jgi:hypothetical protein
MVQSPQGRPALILAVAMAALGWWGLGTELIISLRDDLRDGASLAEGLYHFFRFFTVLTNLGIAVLMTSTTWRLMRERPPPPASLYAAALIYIMVTGVTYELMLRRLWSPSGLMFYADMTMHDIMPTLTLVFWIVFAPKAPLRAGDPLRWLAFPAIYFALTLLAGHFGAGYPYGFFNVERIGVLAVARNALTFLLVFYGFGLGALAVARALPGLAPATAAGVGPGPRPPA